MKNHPNIVLILADDLGYGDLSCFNPESKIRTPEHDRVAREGMVFTDAHASSAVCTPSRYSIVCGRYAWRSRLKRGVLWSYSPPLIEDDRPTIASLLKEQGYRTACIGKWHLGLGWAYPKDYVPSDLMFFDDPGIDFEKPLWSGPHTLGFDESFIATSSLDIPPYFHIHNGRVTSKPTRTQRDSNRPEFWRGGRMSPGFEPHTCLLEYTRRAEAFIDHHAHDDQPFFLYFPTTSPHTPHVPRPPFRGQSEAGVYGDFVCEHDWSIGQILASLDRNGLTDNTLVIITSDNGSHAAPLNLDRQYGHLTNYIFRGQKTDIWDGGHRVALIMRYPDMIEAGSVCDRTICLSDLFRTICEVGGASVPNQAGEDSVALQPLWKNDRFERPPVVHHSAMGQFAIRNEQWKLVTCPGSGGWTMPEDQVPDDLPPMQLYNMEDDVRETKNLYEQHTEIVERLLDELKVIQDGCDVEPVRCEALPQFMNRS